MTKNDELRTIVKRFRANARAELDHRWSEWPLDPTVLHVHEVVGALLARQVSLAGNLAAAPSMWNPHAAPVMLRAMADVIITLAWILESPDQRAQKYVLYGLGQLKLETEHRRAVLDSENPDPGELAIIESHEAWITEQRYPFLTEVNVGAWSETSTRKMAEEAGLLEFYNFVYQTFSGATHSAWHHVGRFNVIYCQNPLHRYHRTPDDPQLPLDPWFLRLAGKYLARAFDVFDNKVQLPAPPVSAFDTLETDLDALFTEAGNGADDSVDLEPDLPEGGEA